jgi:hypothetical protein
MQETFENPETAQKQSKFSPVTIVMGVVVALAILLSLWFLLEPLQSGKPTFQQAVNLNMNAAEQEYAKKIEFANVAMSRAENFLHQEVTTMNGEVYNGGNQPVGGLTLTAEFFDDMNQVVLRETRPVLAKPKTLLGAGERRSFEISFDRVPSSWNMHTPAIRVSHLQLPAQK